MKNEEAEKLNTMNEMLDTIQTKKVMEAMASVGREEVEQAKERLGDAASILEMTGTWLLHPMVLLNTLS